MARSNYDFCGWSTRYNVKCSDGRTILNGAFKDQDGAKVPLVWNHGHDNPLNVLGYGILEHRDEGEYLYGYLNDTDGGRTMKECLKHGDVVSMSIFANHLNESNGYVRHGVIREVSLVLAGANPAAQIEAVFAHSDEDGGEYGEGVLHNEEEFKIDSMEAKEEAAEEVAHNEATDETKEVNIWETFSDEQKQAVYDLATIEIDEKAVTHSEEVDSIDRQKVYDILNNLNDEQKTFAGILIDEIISNSSEEKDESLEHACKDEKKKDKELKEADSATDELSVSAPSLESLSEEELAKKVEEVWNKFTDEQKNAILIVIENAKEKDDGAEEVKHSDENQNGKTVGDIFDTFTDEERVIAQAIIATAILVNNNKGEESEMKHNVFSNETNQKVLTAEEQRNLIHSAMDNGGKFSNFLDANGIKGLEETHEIQHGARDIENLYSDYHNVTETPAWVMNDQEWVSKVLNATKKSPFSKIRSSYATLTEEDARAKGYIKGNMKFENFFSIYKRTTDPETVYAKQKFERDDILDIQDFDFLSWQKQSMNIMLNEEKARAILVGDGRNVSSPDKIDETKIRPIWTDNDVYTIHKVINYTAGQSESSKAQKFIHDSIKARREYKGSGNPVLYVSEDMYDDMLLIQDSLGRDIYDSPEKLKTKLRVSDIVPVPVFEGLTRIVDGQTRTLIGIFANLNDYTVGSVRGAKGLFEDFDIDFNEMKYLAEDRMSGALTLPYSAIVMESVTTLVIDAEPVPSTETVLGKPASELQSGILVDGDYIEGTLKYVTGYTGYSGDAELQDGNFLALNFTAADEAVTTVQLLGGNSGPVTLDSDMQAVFRITNINQKVKVVTSLDGESKSKIYGLKLLKLEQ